MTAEPTAPIAAETARPVLHLPACKVALVLNHASGKRDADTQLDHIRERIRPKVGELATYAVRNGRDIADAARRAANEGADIVVAMGGDGTQCAVAGTLAGSRTVMGVLPGGTFNYFSRDLGVGDTPDAAIDTILGGHVRELDVGSVNGRIFLNNASFGVYPDILEQREAIYRQWGRSRLAAYWSVLLGLRNMRDPMQMTLTLDGETREVSTPLAFAARSAFQLDSMGLDGADAVRNGQFALFLAKGRRPAELMAAAFRLALGKTAPGQDFDLVFADDILIQTRQRNRLLAFDGEKARVNGPFRLRVHRAFLSVIVPAPAPEPASQGVPGG